MSKLKSHARRHKIAQRDGWRCNYCRRVTQCATCHPDATIVATLDHITPRAAHGTNALGNLCISCIACNQAKAVGIWPSEAERLRFSDNGDRVIGYVPGWKRKRLAEPAVNAEGCARTRRDRRGRKSYQTEDAAESAADLVRYRTGKQLSIYRCTRCNYWHLGSPVADEPWPCPGSRSKAGAS